ncbi:3'-5' exonuclease [Paraburkholderia atlantica]|uniref:3'-5' exonuclease n=1 Tax=Paraburkholderia atlantica TaxID=2654982 RepID=UPI0016132B41|nr:3'-5' exonuclease [Paraburkholderia atlantica]MBB5417081.1 DNA helicase IV [Paraburkholderia atlantica]
MKKLTNVTPSPEQYTIIRRVRPGAEVIRGSAGSGKTTTAVLKLKLMILWFLARRQRTESDEPVRALVLTFNKTLRGYINELVAANVPDGKVAVTVDTFGRWAYATLGSPNIDDGQHLEALVRIHAAEIGLAPDFLQDECEYVISRFHPSQLDEYLTCRRDGRGASPRVERGTREGILNKVILPYTDWKAKSGRIDWNDTAILLTEQSYYKYDIVIVDESQDFSANQLRAVMSQVADEHAVSFIIDTAQRIYARGFTWAEAGISIRPESSHRLSVNYRNTPPIARLASSLMQNVTLDDDGTAPSLLDPLEGAAIPVMLKGFFRDQVSWAIEYINTRVDLHKESVAFLHPKGWFTYLKSRLSAAGLDFVEVTQKREWPESNVNIALCTLHSAKGLDFDHVFIIGIDQTGLPEGQFDLGDERFELACRLLSMAIARARIQVVLGFKPGEEPAILARLDRTAYEEIVV